MAVVLRYVNEYGSIIESFLGIVHVKSTTVVSLKEAIEELFCKFGLTTSRIRGKGYDGASDMQGEFGGLKSLILRENPSTFYVRCFAHQLQLTLVAIAKDRLQVCGVFNLVSTIINVVGGSCKRQDMLRENQIKNVKKALGVGEIASGHGLNQETSLKRPADTRWSSHFSTLTSLILMYDSVIDVLKILRIDKSLLREQKAEANALQRKDQDIVNAMHLVNITKQQLQALRDDGWQSLLDGANLFCNMHDIHIPNMDDIYFLGTSKRGSNAESFTIENHYRIEFFYIVVDMQLQELNNHFNETNSLLLICMSCFSPTNLFSSFDKNKLVEFSKFYPREFCPTSLAMLDNQLETYIIDMRTSIVFASLKGIGDLSKKLVETRRHIVYPLVYQLLKLAMILHVATTTVERSFSAMKIVKTRLRCQTEDGWMNDCLVTYIESDVFEQIDDEPIIQRFQNMDWRKGKL